MSQINVTNVRVLDNPAPFTSPFQFEITFESYPPQLTQELEWKLIYVGSADDPQHDQELDSVLVGPVQVGKNKFVFSAPAPDVAAIPTKDLMEVTVILLTALYREKEFIRIGYYVNNEYPETEVEHKREWDAYRQQLDLIAQQQAAIDQQQQEAAEAAAEGGSAAAAAAPAVAAPVLLKVPPPPPMPAVHAERLWRHILDSEPRVTRFHIAWDDVAADEFAMGAEDAAMAVAEEQARGAAGGEGGLVMNEQEREAKRRKVEEGGQAEKKNGKEEKVSEQQDEEDDDDEDDEEEGDRDLSDEDGEDDDDELVELPNGQHAASSSSPTQPLPPAAVV